MSNNELFQAMQMFKQGAQELATSTAISQATEQVNQIRTQIENEGQQRQALMQTANDLALRLAQVGATGQQINAAFEAINPQQFGSPEQMQLFGAGNNSQFLEETGERLIKERENRKLLAELRKAQFTQTKGLGKEVRQNVKDRQKEFNRLAKDQLDILDKVNGATASLDLQNPIADQAMGTLMAKASGEVGNLTEAERDMFRGSPALTRRAQALFTKMKSGILTDADRNDLRELIETYKDMASTAVRGRAKLVSSQMSGNLGMDEEEAMKLILPTSAFESVSRTGNNSKANNRGSVDVKPASSGQPARSTSPQSAPRSRPSLSGFIKGK